MDNSSNVQSLRHGLTPAWHPVTETAEVSHWVRWDALARCSRELLAGQPLREQSAYQAFKRGVTAGDYVLSLDYPPQVSQALLRFTICALYAAAVLGGLLLCFGGAR